MRAALSALVTLLFVAYPVAVYYGLTRLAPRELALWLLPLLALMLLWRLPAGRLEAWREVLKLPAAMLAVLVATALTDDHHFLLMTPVLVNLVLFAGFAGSLRGEMPIVERYARLQASDLSPAEVAYCRRVTLVWSAFFVLNGGTAALLAVFAPVAWWALFTGLISYVLIGLVSAVEYVIRKHRFGRFADHVLDRALRAFLTRRPVSG